jgi:pimeloyl-ACP methyl ester carboxylesterase
VRSRVDIAVVAAAGFATMAPSMRAPALIMHSEDDTVCPIAPAREAARLWHGATFKPLNGLGTRLLGDAAVIAGAVAVYRRSRALGATALEIRSDCGRAERNGPDVQN